MQPGVCDGQKPLSVRPAGLCARPRHPRSRRRPARSPDALTDGRTGGLAAGLMDEVRALTTARPEGADSVALRLSPAPGGRCGSVARAAPPRDPRPASAPTAPGSPGSPPREGAGPLGTPRPEGPRPTREEKPRTAVAVPIELIRIFVTDKIGR